MKFPKQRKMKFRYILLIGCLIGFVAVTAKNKVAPTQGSMAAKAVKAVTK